MAIQHWSDNIIVAELTGGLQFAEDLTTLIEMLENNCVDVVINLAAVNHLNSSNIAALLRLRKQIIAGERKLILCGVGSQVGNLFGVTGLDKIFEFTDDMATALTTIQLENRPQDTQ